MAEPTRRGRGGAALRHARRTARERVSAPGVGEVADAVRLSGRRTASRSARAGSRARAPTCVIFGYGPWLLANACQAADDVRGAHGRARAARGPAVAEPRGPRLAARRDRHAGASWSRSTTTTCTADRARWWPRPSPRLALRAGGPRHAHRRDVAARVRHQRRGAGAPRPRRGGPGAAVRTASRRCCERRYGAVDDDRSVLGHRRHAAHDRQGRHVRVGRRRQGDHRPRLPAGVDAHPGHDRLPDRGPHASSCSASTPTATWSSAWCAATRSCCRRACRASTGHVLPNVREILETACAGATDVRSYLLTGNTRGGAQAKLTHYGLWSFFPDGAFAEDTASARHHRRARDGAGPARRARGRGGRVRDRRHAARHRVRQRHRRAHDRRGDRRLRRRGAAGARARGGSSTSCRRRTTSCGSIDVRRRARPAEPRAGMKHGIRRVPALWRATRLARRWYHARSRRLSRLAAICSPRESGAVGVGARAPPAAARAC